MKETLKHEKAFDYYYSLGDTRSIPKVSQKFGVGYSEAAVKRWSRNFNWQERIRQRDIENSKEIFKKTDNAIVNAKADHRSWIKKQLKQKETEYNCLSKVYGTAKQKIEKGEIEVGSIKDLVELSKAMQGVDKERREFVKLDLLLMGETVDQHEVTVKLDVMSEHERTEYLRLLSEFAKLRTGGEKFAKLHNGGEKGVAEPGADSQ